MSAYRLVVRTAGKPVSQGTAWLLRPNLAVTAFHVVGKTSVGAFFHEAPESGGSVTYHLLDGTDEVPLEPVARDLRADVALLRCRQTLATPRTLALAEEPPTRSTAFRAEGYPAFLKEAPFTVSGEIVEIRGDASSTAMQIFIREGTHVSWVGISGSAIQVGARVAGVITQMTNGAATGWAASALAVQRLERIYDAGDVRGRCRDLLLKLYSDHAHLVDLRADLGWPAEGSGYREAAAERLVDRAALEGAEGLLRLLDEIGNDHPQSREVELLRWRVLARARQGARSGAPSRAQRVREVLQELGKPEGAGVAIVEPLGFQGRALVDEVLAQLKRPNEVLLPVRFVPDRRTTDEERLYNRLLRDLRYAVPKPWRKYVDDQTDKSARDRFEYAVEDLLEGPVKEAKRKLLFVVEGLDRVPQGQVESWAFLLAQLSDRGLKLLVWGGQELHDLRTRPPQGGLFSPFHVLQEVRIGPFSPEEVQRLLEKRGGDGAAAAVVHAETGGHPALVTELVERFVEEACAGNREAIAARILDGAHLERLWQIVEGEPVWRERLRELAAIEEGKPLPRERRRVEARLYWLGIIKDGGAGRWAWMAPVMRRFAGEWA